MPPAVDSTVVFNATGSGLTNQVDDSFTIAGFECNAGLHRSAFIQGEGPVTFDITGPVDIGSGFSNGSCEMTWTNASRISVGSQAAPASLRIGDVSKSSIRAQTARSSLTVESVLVFEPALDEFVVGHVGPGSPQSGSRIGFRSACPTLQQRQPFAWRGWIARRPG